MMTLYESNDHAKPLIFHRKLKIFGVIFRPKYCRYAKKSLGDEKFVFNQRIRWDKSRDCVVDNGGFNGGFLGWVKIG